MAEYRLFEEGTVPECATPGWYAGREVAPHIDQEMHQGRLHLAAELVQQAADQFGFDSVVDLGCGDGGLLTLLRDFNAWGYDITPSNVVAAADRGVQVGYADVLKDSIRWADIAVCTEMLEHLLDPAGFVRMIAEHSPVIVASSPWTETADAHYEFHLWAWDQDGYRALIEQAGYRVIAQKTNSMFQVILGAR